MFIIFIKFVIILFAVDCVKQTVSKALGTGIIVGATFGEYLFPCTFRNFFLIYCTVIGTGFKLSIWFNFSVKKTTLSKLSMFFF